MMSVTEKSVLKLSTVEVASLRAWPGPNAVRAIVTKLLGRSGGLLNVWVVAPPARSGASSR